MLSDSDLNVFVELVRRVEDEPGRKPGIHPVSALSSDRCPNGLLHKAERFRLWKSLKLASAVGDAPETCHLVLRAIIDAFPAKHRGCLPLTHTAEWMNAIRWARLQPITPSLGSLIKGYKDRESIVGAACGRLRRRAYSISIGTHGPCLLDDTRKQIAADIDFLIAQFGGINTLNALFALMGRGRTVHDGMWLFGIAPTSTGRSPDPGVPIAWLLSIALRHIDRRPQTAGSTSSWTKAIELATDFAASMDCQRYSQFEDLYAEPHDFLRILEESLKWRELFTLPQVPPSTLKTIRTALLEASWPNDLASVHRTVAGMFSEVDVLLDRLSVDATTEMPQRTAQVSFPLLWRYACGRNGKVNTEYLDPFGAVARNHERFVFFEVDGGRVILLTPAMVAANACEAIFRLVWDGAGSVASDIVGETLEKSVALACKAHTPSVVEGLRYKVNKVTLEMDVGVQQNEGFVLFETKAKSLTSRSRTGDIVGFIDDYTKSFLALLRQLVRHEHHIQNGRTPLGAPIVDSDSIRVTKVAVSPVSYGPVADHGLAGTLLRAMAQSRLHVKSQEGEHVRILEAFNKKLEQVMADIEAVAPRRDGAIDLFRYMLDVFWLDLGELLYVLQRGRSVPDAVSALRHLTFGTRDFWTEVAWADRQGLTKDKWHQLPIP